MLLTFQKKNTATAQGVIFFVHLFLVRRQFIFNPNMFFVCLQIPQTYHICPVQCEKEKNTAIVVNKGF